VPVAARSTQFRRKNENRAPDPGRSSWPDVPDVGTDVHPETGDKHLLLGERAPKATAPYSPLANANIASA
jgi:hypothetical protein